MKKIIAIVGSLRKDSFNRQLAEATKAAIGDRADFEILSYDDVPFFNEDIESPAPAPVSRVREAIKAADAVWFFTPEYNHSYPGVLKNLIDWLSRPFGDEAPVLAGKAVTVSGASYSMAGTALAQETLLSMLLFLNANIMGAQRLLVGSVHEQFDEGGKLKLTVSEPFLKDQIDAFLSFLA